MGPSSGAAYTGDTIVSKTDKAKKKYKQFLSFAIVFNDFYGRHCTAGRAVSTGAMWRCFQLLVILAICRFSVSVDPRYIHVARGSTGKKCERACRDDFAGMRLATAPSAVACKIGCVAAVNKKKVDCNKQPRRLVEDCQGGIVIASKDVLNFMMG